MKELSLISTFLSFKVVEPISSNLFQVDCFPVFGTIACLSGKHIWKCSFSSLSNSSVVIPELNITTSSYDDLQRSVFLHLQKYV